MRQIKINYSITDRSEESLDKYLVEISRIPLISPEKEVELAQTIRKGGKEGEKAKDKLVTSNLRFVVSVAKQYQHQGVPLSDLINEARREAALNEQVEELTNEMQRYLDAIQESENLIAKLKERNAAEEIINDEIELISSNKQKAEELKKKIKALNEQKD